MMLGVVIFKHAEGRLLYMYSSLGDKTTQKFTRISYFCLFFFPGAHIINKCFFTEQLRVLKNT